MGDLIDKAFTNLGVAKHKMQAMLRILLSRLLLLAERLNIFADQANAAAKNRAITDKLKLARSIMFGR